VAAQATRFLSDARRNGALELILCTPVTVSEIIRGQWSALLRMSFLPVLVILLMNAAQQVRMWSQLKESFKGSLPSPGINMALYQVLSGVSGTLVFLSTLVALGWFGMLMGLRSKKTSIALMKTLVLVQVLPFLAAAILQGLLMFAIMWLRVSGYWGGLMASVLVLLKNAAFIFWSRRRLHKIFREAAAQSFDIARPRKAPPVPPRINPDIPPVIPA
jgi:hypothetical protein